MKATVYLETTIVSYLAARPSRDLVVAAHQEITWEWWDTRRGAYDLRVSQQVVDEAGAGDPTLAGRRLELLRGIPLVELNEETGEVAKALTEEGPVPAGEFRDAVHIAVATVHRVDYLLTWNCSHIANAHMRAGIAATCQRHGYREPVICTPEELLEETDVER